MAVEKFSNSKDVEDFQEEKEKPSVLDAIIKKCGYNPLEIDESKATVEDCAYLVEIMVDEYIKRGFEFLEFEKSNVSRLDRGFYTNYLIFKIKEKGVTYVDGYNVKKMTDFPFVKYYDSPAEALFHALKSLCEVNRFNWRFRDACPHLKPIVP